MLMRNAYQYDREFTRSSYPTMPVPGLWMDERKFWFIVICYLV